MLLILLFLVTAKSSQVVVCSSSTPELLKAYFPIEQLLKIDSVDPSTIFQSFESFSFDVIIDITLQPHLFPVFDRVCDYFSTYYLTISPATSSFSNYRFHVHNSFESLAHSLNILAKGLNWVKSAILYSAVFENMQVAYALAPELGLTNTTEISFEPNISETSANLIIGKMVKNNGVSNLIVLAYGSSLLTIQKALIAKKMSVSGSLFIFPSKAIWSASVIGSMIVVEKGLEFANSWEEYEFLALNNAMKRLSSLRISASPFTNNIINTEYSLVNIKSQGRVIVGSIGTSLTLNDTFTYPGNTTVYDSQPIKSIIVSIANGTNITDLGNSQFQQWYMGSTYAAQLSIKNNEIPNFQIDLKPTLCDSKVEPFSWFLNCFKNQKLGVAYLTGISDLSSVYNINAIRAYKKYVPQLSPLMQTDLLNNRTAYPEFLKMTVSFVNFFSNVGYLLYSLGYKNVAMLSSNDSFYLSVYKIAAEQLELRGVKIVNPPEKRHFSATYNSTQFEANKENFMAVKNSRVRALFTVGTIVGELMEGLYDVGLRKGDIIIFGTGQLTYWVSETSITKEKLMKRYEMFSGGITVAYQEYAGTIGPELKEKMGALYGDTTNLCFSYDSFQVIKEAIKQAIRNGLDYEDPNILLRYMRLNRLDGCLGNIFFDPDKNSRSQAKFLMGEILIDSEANNISHIDLAVVDLLSAKPMTFFNTPYWYSGTTSIPSEFRAISRCPFDKYQIQQSKNGIRTLYIIVYVLLLYLIAVSLYFYKISDKNFSLLTQSTQVSSEDMVCIIFFFFETIQILVMGPDQDMYMNAVNNIQSLISLDFDLYFKFKDEKYWLLLNTVIGISGLLNFMAMCVIMRLTMLKSVICEKFNDIFLIYSPLVAHISFLPMISMMLSIFLCDHEIGSKLTDSFLSQDCSVFCYKDKHAVYATLSLLTLVLFIPLAIYCRYLLQIISISLHIRTKSVYILFINIFQMLLIALNKTIKPFNQRMHGLVSIAVILVFIVISILLKPYSYQRANIFQFTALFVGLWGVICATGNQYSQNLTAWTIAEFSGFGLIIVSGIYLSMKYPRLLYSQKGNKVPILFLFQFLKKYEQHVVKNYNDIMNAGRNSTYKVEDSNIE